MFFHSNIETMILQEIPLISTIYQKLKSKMDRMGLFWGCSLLGGKKPSPQNLSRLSYNDETWLSYTLPKENSKNLWITWHTFCVLLTSAFLYQKLGNLALSRNTDIDCILVVSNSFNFFWVFKDWSSKHGYNFDDVSKNGYSRPS